MLGFIVGLVMGVFIGVYFGNSVFRSKLNTQVKLGINKLMASQGSDEKKNKKSVKS